MRRQFSPKTTGCFALVASLLSALEPLGAQAGRSAGVQPALITGTVHGEGDRALVGAHVRLLRVRNLDPDGAPEVATARVDSRGVFAIATPTPGNYALAVDGPAHQSTSTYLNLRAGDSLHVAVRLQQVAWRATFDSIVVVGDFNNFKLDSTARTLRRQADGRLMVDVSSTLDTVYYALAKVARRALVPNRGLDGVVRTSNGDYRSAALVRQGIARIIVDPSAFVPDTTSASARYAPGPVATFARMSDSVMSYQRDQPPQAGSPSSTGPWRARVTRAEASLARATTARDRGAHLLELLALAQAGVDVSPRVGRQAMREIRPTDPLWTSATSLAMALPIVAVDLADSVLPVHQRLLRREPVSGADSVRYRQHLPRMFAWLDSAVTASDDDYTTAQWLQFAVSVSAGWDDERASRQLARLQTEFPDVFATRFAMQVWGGNRPLRKGAVLPAFSVSALGVPGQRLAPSAFAGKTVLIDFWATWCRPCIDEMPTLHGAWDQYHARGLQIFSVSFDATETDVAQFRNKKWPMPWQHGWESGGLTAPTLKALGLYGLPQIVLVGPDGTILAEGRDLRGGALAVTLGKVLR